MHASDELVIPYVDRVEGFKGWVAFDGRRNRLSAGGLRVQAGLNEETVRALARAMSLKQRLLGLAVDGAKAGIDYKPQAPGKRDAIRRFLRFLRPHILERFSVGPDMGTTWSDLEEIAREEGLTSVKMAVARAQGLDPDDFLGRLRLLDADFGGLTLAQRRAGHALAHAALAVVERAGLARCEIRVGIQGFGTLGRGVACSLSDAGVIPVAVADENGCVVEDRGVDLCALLAVPPGEIIGRGRGATHPPRALFDTPLDVVVLAACEDAMSQSDADHLPSRAVVVGANLGLTSTVEALLHDRGVLVVPDLVGGCGGSASMDALFGAETCPTAKQVLEDVGARVREVVVRVLERSEAALVPPRQAALELCQATPEQPGGCPYGRWARERPSR